MMNTRSATAAASRMTVVGLAAILGLCIAALGCGLASVCIGECAEETGSTGDPTEGSNDQGTQSTSSDTDTSPPTDTDGPGPTAGTATKGSATTNDTDEFVTGDTAGLTSSGDGSGTGSGSGGSSDTTGDGGASESSSGDSTTGFETATTA